MPPIHSPIEFERAPWSDRYSWEQMRLSLAVSVKAQGERLRRAREISHHIARKLCSIDAALDTLCRSTCIYCSDICCSRATLWYDFRDLLFIHLYSDTFPPQQICRNEDLTCSCLTLSGCRLNRHERPFICTWYICPKQNEFIQQDNPLDNVAHISLILLEIKSDRKELEQAFLDAMR